MSLKDDLRKRLPENVVDPTKAYSLEKITNNFTYIFHQLLNHDVTSSDIEVGNLADWDSLPDNTFSNVVNFNGKNAPDLNGSGLVFNLNNTTDDMQMALGHNQLAFRVVGNPWYVMTGSDNQKVMNMVSNKLDMTIGGIKDAARNAVDATQKANIQIKNINKSLKNKQNILDGPILDSDLNNDTQYGTYIINKGIPLLNTPNTTYQDHDVGLLAVRHTGDNNLLQILYMNLGNPNNKFNDKNDLDGSGTVSYRFAIRYHKYIAFQPWHTVPYQSDFEDFKSDTASNFNSANSATANYVNSLNNVIKSDYNHNIDYTNTVSSSMKSYTDSNVALANQHTDNQYAKASNQESTDTGSLSDELTSMTQSAKSAEAIQASNEAINLAHNMNATSGQMQDALMNLQNFETNVSGMNQNTEGQITQLSNSTSIDYQNTNAARTQLGVQMSEHVNLAIDSNNATLNNHWSASLSNNNTSLNNNISAEGRITSLAATRYTQSVGNDNYSYTNSQAGSIDTRLWGLSNELNNPSFKAPASKANSIANSLSGVNFDSINNRLNGINISSINTQLNSLADQLTEQKVASAENNSGSYTPLGNSAQEAGFYSQKAQGDLYHNYEAATTGDPATSDGTFYSLSGRESFDAESLSYFISNSVYGDSSGASAFYQESVDGLTHTYVPPSATSTTYGTIYSLSGQESYDVFSNSSNIKALSTSASSLLSDYESLSDNTNINSASISNYVQVVNGVGNEYTPNTFAHIELTSFSTSSSNLASVVSNNVSSINSLVTDSQSNNANWWNASSMATTNQEQINSLENQYPDNSVLTSELYTVNTLSAEVTNNSSSLSTLSVADAPVNDSDKNQPGLYVFSISKMNGQYVDSIYNDIPISQLNIDVPLDNLKNEPSHPLSNYSSNTGFMRIYKDPLGLNSPTNMVKKCKIYFTNDSYNYVVYTYISNLPSGYSNGGGYGMANYWARVKPAP